MRMSKVIYMRVCACTCVRARGAGYGALDGSARRAISVSTSVLVGKINPL